MSSRPARAVKGWPGPLSSRNRPNSFAEWIVGCNLPAPLNVPGQGVAPEFALATAHIPRLQTTPEPASMLSPAPPGALARPAAQETVSSWKRQPAAMASVPAGSSAKTAPISKDLRLQLEVYADSLDQTDTMTITLPRPGSSQAHRAVLDGRCRPDTFDKSVTFCGGLKSALKTPRATIVELSTDSSSSSVSDNESSSSSKSAGSGDDDTRASRHHKKISSRRHNSRDKHSRHSYSHHSRHARHSHSCTRRRRSNSCSPCDCDCDNFLRGALHRHGRLCKGAARRYSHHNKGSGNHDGFFVTLDSEHGKFFYVHIIYIILHYTFCRQLIQLDIAWSDGNSSDLFYRFTDSETFTGGNKDKVSSTLPPFTATNN